MFGKKPTSSLSSLFGGSNSNGNSSSLTQRRNLMGGGDSDMDDDSSDDDSIEIEVEEVDDMEPMPGTFSFKRRSPFYLGNSRTTQWRNRVKEGKRLEEIRGMPTLETMFAKMKGSEPAKVTPGRVSHIQTSGVQLKQLREAKNQIESIMARRPNFGTKEFFQLATILKILKYRF